MKSASDVSKWVPGLQPTIIGKKNPSSARDVGFQMWPSRDLLDRYRGDGAPTGPQAMLKTIKSDSES